MAAEGNYQVAIPSVPIPAGIADASDAGSLMTAKTSTSGGSGSSGSSASARSPIKKYVMGRLLGKGTSGSVRLVKLRRRVVFSSSESLGALMPAGDGGVEGADDADTWNDAHEDIYVLKEIKMTDFTELDLKHAAAEVRALAMVSHPFIIGHHESFVHRQHLYIVMEYADGGDLEQMIRRRLDRGKYLKERIIREWFTMICMAVSCLHKHGILHRDIKTQNIFLTRNYSIRLGDFGLTTIRNADLSSSSSRSGSRSGLANTLLGTPYYLSPELCRSEGYGSKNDVWALGCVLFRMTALKHAFPGSSLHELVALILNSPAPKLPKGFSSELQELLDVILTKDPSKRPSVDDLLELPVLADEREHLLNRTPEGLHRSVSLPQMNERAYDVLRAQLQVLKDERDAAQGEDDKPATKPSDGPAVATPRHVGSDSDSDEVDRARTGRRQARRSDSRNRRFRTSTDPEADAASRDGSSDRRHSPGGRFGFNETDSTRPWVVINKQKRREERRVKSSSPHLRNSEREGRYSPSSSPAPGAAFGPAPAVPPASQKSSPVRIPSHARDDGGRRPQSSREKRSRSKDRGDKAGGDKASDGRRRSSGRDKKRKARSNDELLRREKLQSYGKLSSHTSKRLQDEDVVRLSLPPRPPDFVTHGRFVIPTLGSVDGTTVVEPFPSPESARRARSARLSARGMSPSTPSSPTGTFPVIDPQAPGASTSRPGSRPGSGRQSPAMTGPRVSGRRSSLASPALSAR